MKWLYLPHASASDVANHDEQATEPQENRPYAPCPCCGYLTIPNRGDALAYICPVCMWEIDLFSASPDEPSDQNHGLLLHEARSNFMTYGAVLASLAQHCRKPKREELPENAQTGGLSMQNPVLDCILTRRSVRRYQQRPVPQQELELLLQAAIYAPSGNNSQSWLFTVVRNPNTLEQLNLLVRQGFLALPDDTPSSPRAAAKKRAQSDEFCFYYHAPALIIASNQPNYANALPDCSAALQNIFLAAHSLGLGSCWVNQLRWLEEAPALRNFLAGLGIPKEHTICGAAAVGYPLEELPPAPTRKPGTINWADSSTT